MQQLIVTLIFETIIPSIHPLYPLLLNKHVKLFTVICLQYFFTYNLSLCTTKLQQFQQYLPF